MTAMNDAALPFRTGIVVIGRNEGHRLAACLASIRPLGLPIVYVDSGSTDGSFERDGPGFDVALALDPLRPFSAARARNEGFQLLREKWPDVGLIQFLDADCTLVPSWIAAAERAMKDDLTRAVVVGHLRERYPEASDYNRLCALEWKSVSGDLANFGALGGIMLARVAVFERLGGFNEHMIAGEDSEFGVRVALAGLRVTKIDAEMATHDADMHRFSQWWRRAVRGGHAIGQRFSLNGRDTGHDCKRERRSVLFWGATLPATIVALAPATRGLSLILLGGYLVLSARIFRYRLVMGDSAEEAALYARFVVLGKFAELLGLLTFYFNRMAGRFRIIEYKRSARTIQRRDQ